MAFQRRGLAEDDPRRAQPADPRAQPQVGEARARCIGQRREFDRGSAQRGRARSRTTSPQRGSAQSQGAGRPHSRGSAQSRGPRASSEPYPGSKRAKSGSGSSGPNEAQLWITRAEAREEARHVLRQEYYLGLWKNEAEPWGKGVGKGWEQGWGKGQGEGKGWGKGWDEWRNPWEEEGKGWDEQRKGEGKGWKGAQPREEDPWKSWGGREAKPYDWEWKKKIPSWAGEEGYEEDEEEEALRLIAWADAEKKRRKDEAEWRTRRDQERAEQGKDPRGSAHPGERPKERLSPGEREMEADLVQRSRRLLDRLRKAHEDDRGLNRTFQVIQHNQDRLGLFFVGVNHFL